MNETETLQAVCRQRDRLRVALSDLIDSFWCAHYNHAFDGEDKMDGKDKKCSKGRTLQNCFNGCEYLDKDGCRGFDCPMGYNHRKMLKHVYEAADVLSDNLAERIPFDLKRIPQYYPERLYEVTDRWYARMILMLLTELSFTKDMTKERAEEFGRALLSLVAIGLSTFKVQTPFKKIWKVYKEKAFHGEYEGDPEIKVFQGNLEKCKPYFDSLEKIQRKNHDEFIESLTGDHRLAMAFLVKECMTILAEYDFDKEYPGADRVVYEASFSELKYICCRIYGFDTMNKFDIVTNENDVNVDGIGIKIWI